MKRLAILLAVTLLCSLAAANAVVAQSAVDVRESSAESDFPTGVTFLLQAGGPIDEVRLVYEIGPKGVRNTAPVDCAGGAVVTCTYTLAAGRGADLVPGAELTYFWRVTQAGETQETQAQSVVYIDDRFDWSTISDGNLTLWWYAGSEEDARSVLAAARESLDRTSALLETTVDFPVKVLYYASAGDMAAATAPDDSRGTVTLGEVVYDDTAMVSASEATEDIARHEVAHIVAGAALDGPFGVPDWLSEGTAVFAQSRPLQNNLDALEQAIRSNRVFSVRSLSSASLRSQGTSVSLFYGQAWSLVDFLVTEYGEEQFAALFRAFDAGATTAEALQQVYGFDQDGLENAWRESVGLPPRVAPEVEATEASPSSATERDGDGGVSTGVVVAIAVLTVALAGGLAGAGVLLARRYR